jgi:hypothetical protein
VKQRIVPAERVWLDKMPPAEVRGPLCDWLRHHGIDPNDVCVSPGWIERDPHRRRVRYLTYGLDGRGQPLRDPLALDHDELLRVAVAVQLEAEPSPFPLTRPDSGST